MRFEFHDDGTLVGTAQWEGPGQVTFDVPDARRRDELQRYFAQESDYLATAFEENEDALQSRRRDWTPWEFERSATALGYRMGLHVVRTPNEPVAGEREPARAEAAS